MNDLLTAAAGWTHEGDWGIGDWGIGVINIRTLAILARAIELGANPDDLADFGRSHGTASQNHVARPFYEDAQREIDAR